MRNRRTRRIVVTAMALFALALVAACGPPVPPPPPPAPSSPVATDIVERHNYLRSLNGIGGLAVDGGMQANAQLHADRLASGPTSCSGSLRHSPELGSWYPGSYAGENVACVPGCPTGGGGAFDMWLNSPPHKANVLQPAYAKIGVATKCNGSVMMVVAQYRSG